MVGTTNSVNPVNRQEQQNKEFKIIGLEGFPQELMGIMPENVWNMLAEDQKIDILVQHNLQKYLQKVENPMIPMEQGTGVKPETVSNVPVTQENAVVTAVKDVTIQSAKPENQDSSLVQMKSDFEKMKQEVKSSEEQLKTIEKQPLPDDIKKNIILSEDDKNRIAEEKGGSAQIKVMKFFGYTPSTSLQSNATTISDDESVEDSKTWAATLIKKIMAAMFN